MAKKQTRRSISVSRVTYERLKAFCEANNISMSQFVETRVGDFLGETAVPAAPRPTPTIGGGSGGGAGRAEPNRSAMPSTMPGTSRPTQPAPSPAMPAPQRPTAPVPMTAASARYAVEPPPPIIKKVDHEPAPAPIAKTADQIFTF